MTRIKTWILSLALIFVAASVQANSVTLAWDPSADATGYKVYWGTASRNYPNSVDVGNVTQATVPGLINTITYFFAVTAYNEAGESGYSDEISVTIPPLLPPEYPAYYPGVFTWSYPVTSDSLLGFIISRREAGVAGAKQWSVLGESSRTLPMTDLIPGSAYEFQVVAFTRFERRLILSESSSTLSHTEPLVEYLSGTPVVLAPAFMLDGSARLVFYGPQHGSPEVFASSDLMSWTSLGLATEYVAGRYRIFDPAGSTFTQRFYKIVQ